MRRYSPKRRRLEMLKEIIDWKKAAIIGGVVVVAIIVITLIANSGKPKPADTPYAKEGRIIVGVTADTPLGYQDENENPVGYEVDVITQVLSGIYGADMRIEYQIINSQQASYRLKKDEIDCALAMLPSDVTKTRGLLLSDAYYRDEVQCFIQPGSAAGIDNLKGKTIGVMTTAVARKQIQSELEEAGFIEKEIDIRACTSYPDAWESLRNGEISALIMPKHYVEEEQAKDFEILNTGDIFAPVGYKIALWTDDSKLKELINDQLQKMTNEKSLQMLQEKWGLLR